MHFVSSFHAARARQTGLSWLLVVLPVFSAVLALCFSSLKEPRYAYGVDPQYAYLMSTLNLARGHSPGFNDHPGITVKLLGALTMRVTHMFISGVDLATDVATLPEVYLSAINVSFVLLYSGLLWFAGLLTLRSTRRISLALCLQLTPFLVLSHFLSAMSEVRAEPVLFIAALWVGTMLASRLSSYEPKESRSWCVLLAAAFGFGVATKLSFAPLAVIPAFTISSWRMKLFYVAAICGSFILWCLPIVHDYAFLDQVRRWVFHAGTYGYGPRALLGAGFVSNAITLYASERVFFLVLGACAATWLVTAILRISGLATRGGYASRLLTGLLAAELLQIFFVARTGMPNYMIPSLGMSGLTLATTAYCLLTVSVRWRQVAVVASYGAILSASLFAALINVPVARSDFSILLGERAELKAFLQTSTAQLKGYLCIYSYYAPFLEYGLYAGSITACSSLLDLLKMLHPNVFFYVGLTPSGVVSDWTSPLDLRDLFLRHDKIAFVGDTRCTNLIKRIGVPLRNVVQIGHYAAYALDASGMKPGQNEQRFRRLSTRRAEAAKSGVLTGIVFHALFDKERRSENVYPALAPEGARLKLSTADTNVYRWCDTAGYCACPSRMLSWDGYPALAKSTSMSVAVALHGRGEAELQVPVGQGMGSSASNSPWFLALGPGPSNVQYVIQFVQQNGEVSESRISVETQCDFRVGWHWLVGSYDHESQVQRLSLDGIEVGSCRLVSAAGRNPMPLAVTVGSLSGEAYPYSGWIREVLVLDHALPPEEIRNHFSFDRGD